MIEHDLRGGGALMQRVAAGLLKSVYDVLLYARFRRAPLPEEPTARPNEGGR